MNPKIYITRAEKQRDFLIGMVAWFVVNLILFGCTFLLLSLLSYPGIDLQFLQLMLGLIPFILNIAALIFFAFNRRWIALGALSSLAFLFFCGLCLCLSPSFIGWVVTQSPTPTPTQPPACFNVTLN